MIVSGSPDSAPRLNAGTGRASGRLTVEVRLFATLAAFLPPGSRDGATRLDLPEGSTVADVVVQLGIPPDMPWVALLNGDDAPGERPLASGDQLALFPPLAGG